MQYIFAHNKEIMILPDMVPFLPSVACKLKNKEEQDILLRINIQKVLRNCEFWLRSALQG